MNTKQPYSQRIVDHRNVWINGSKVDNISEHKAFKGTIQTIEHLLSLQHGTKKEDLTYVTEEGENAHLSFLVPTTLEELERKNRAYKLWADETFGIMSRLSEYSRVLFAGWYGNRRHLNTIVPGIHEKLEQFYTRSRNLDYLSTIASQDIQKNRGKSLLEKEQGQLRIISKNTEGVIVRGAKTIATAAPYVDEYIISSFHKRGEDEEQLANIFFIPAALEGLHIVCRPSFASLASEDQPLSARYDEMDAVLIFDDVLIPWENVLVYEDPEAAWKLQKDIPANLLSQHQTVVRLISKLETVASVALALGKTADTIVFSHVKGKLSELFVQIETIKSLLQAAEQTATLHHDILLPNGRFLTAARNLGTRYYPRGIEIIHQIGASGLLQVPSTIEELKGPIGDLILPYFTGTTTSAYDRTRLIKLAWDLIGSPLAARHELYERFYSGDPVRTYAAHYNQYPDKQQLVKFAYQLI